MGKKTSTETSLTGEKTHLALVPVPTPLITNYKDRIRPLLDAVDKLRHLKVMAEGIQLPTIVVVGDQSSSKSSVLESLAGISLPRGQGICTRVPLIMRLQNHPSPNAELFLKYNEKAVPTLLAGNAVAGNAVAFAISNATEEIAGNAKGISNTPLTLVVEKQGVPDLAMVDLPGITRVPVHGQPEGLLEKVTADDVNIGLCYVCVRNRIGDESYEESRKEEARMFGSHPPLSKIDKSIVGVPVLAQKLVQFQANSISRCLPDIVKKINEKLSQSMVATINQAKLELSPLLVFFSAVSLPGSIQSLFFGKES